MHRALPLPWSLALLLAACSTRAAPMPSQDCEVDDDCAEGVCDPFSARCVSGDERPPRANLAFDIRETSSGETLFRAEVFGCDRSVTASQDGLSELEFSRSETAQSFSLFVYNTAEPLNNSVLPTAEELISGRIELEQSGRLGLRPDPKRTVTQAFSEEVTMATRVAWPRYHPEDSLTPPPFLVWKTAPEALGPIDPDNPAPPIAPMIQMLVPPATITPVIDDVQTPCVVNEDCCDGDCTDNPNYCIDGGCTAIGDPGFNYGFVYHSECNREVSGTVLGFDLETGLVTAPIEGANVAFRHADPIGEGAERFGASALGLAPTCDEDSECGDGRFCSGDGVCLLTLAGRRADNNGVATADDGTFSRQTYTYCGGGDSPDRSYAVTVTPDAAVASMSYFVNVEYPAVLGPVAPLEGALCIPTWGPAYALALPLQGAPLDLAGTGDTLYRCCDVGCLPAEAEDAEQGPQATPSACAGRTAAGATPTIRLQAALELDDDDLFSLVSAGCALPTLPEDQTQGPYAVGSLRVDADCPVDGAPCSATGLAAGSNGVPRGYSVRIESPAGSVLASRDTQVAVAVNQVTGEIEPVTPIRLDPRTLVRGVVDVAADVCAERSDPSECASHGAIVIAERLAMPGETPETVPGPYLHQVSTFYDPSAGRDGSFVLPLDPGGVYVLTALPAAGEDGGPSAFRVLDLRTDDPAPLQLVLEKGILVTMDLGSFDRRTLVSPLDVGPSSVDALPHPGEGRAVDLNLEGECLSDAGGACQIRKLLPPGSNISVSQVGLARFTARRAVGADTCGSNAD